MNCPKCGNNISFPEKEHSDNQDVSWLISEIPQKIMNGEIVVPGVQRGLVWNAVRTEILWDSIMRGIPIGVLTVRKNENGKYELFDGQQRVNAISMGYSCFPKEKEEKKPILWIDLCPPENLNVERKFFFMLTTLSQPWGYRISNDERSNTRLDTREKRDAINRINWKKKDGNGIRPYPYELFPVKAKRPVPFSLLREYLSKNPNSTFDEFAIHCEQYNSLNWKIFWDNSIRNDKHWEMIKESIQKVNNMSVIAHNITFFEDDIGIYFQRMNKSGYEPDNEEIRYSRLKAKIPELKTLDELSENKMKPSRLAHIAMISYKSSEKGEKCSGGISNSDIISFCNNRSEFSSFVINQMKELMRKLEVFLLYCKEQNQFGLPNVIYASVCQRPVLYALLLHIIKRKMVFSFEEKKILIGFCTLLLWFRKNDSIDIAAYNFFMDCEFNLNAVKNCLFMLTMNNFLEIPPILKEDNQESISKRICDISELEHFLRIPYNIDRIWGWTKNEAREILLYATRDYIEDSFGGYSPWNGCWDEENRPWDYDHIFPQSWLKGSYQGANHDFSARIINSIGNIAPLPFSSNRSKNDDPPGDYMKEEINRKLLLPLEFNHPLRYDVENVIEHVKIVSSFVLSRFQRIYFEWYNALEINSLLDFDSSSISDKRREILEMIKNNIPDLEGFFTHDNMYQYVIETNSDWARQWVSVGRDFGESYDFFPAVTIGKINQNTFQVEVGLRRHPKLISVEGKSIWYKNSPTVTRFSDLDDIDCTELINMLRNLIQDINQSALLHT